MASADPSPQLRRLDLSGEAGYLSRGSWRLTAVDRHRLELDAEPGAQSQVRVALRDWLADLSEARRDDVILLASELVSNAVRHVAGREGRTIDVHVARAAGVVRVEVCDGGPPFVPRLREPGPTGGFGLLLIDRIAERWGAASDAPSCVWVEVATGPSPAPPPAA